MLTFCSDLWLTFKHGDLRATGDHIYVAHGERNSWADGVYTLFGQDAIDFELTFAKIDKQTNTATLQVKHVPPSKPKLKMPTAWMENQCQIVLIIGHRYRNNLIRAILPESVKKHLSRRSRLVWTKGESLMAL
jgi:hypothetical protein